MVKDKIFRLSESKAVNLEIHILRVSSFKTCLGGNINRLTASYRLVKNKTFWEELMPTSF